VVRVLCVGVVSLLGMVASVVVGRALDSYPHDPKGRARVAGKGMLAYDDDDDDDHHHYHENVG
jgi:hypothetical protein